MKAPTATYRVQLNQAFGFTDLKQILPYLTQLGISHVYASPIFQAKKGSTHGYDITDQNTISKEIGGQAAFEDLMREVAACGLEWLQDIVPNHASYSMENKMVSELLEKGEASPYGAYFDVDWSYPSSLLRGKLLAPFLTEAYAETLKNGKLSLTHNGGFKIKYDGIEFPVNAEASKKLLSHASIQQVIKKYNQNSDLLDELLSSQFFALAYWKTALKHINYRRFFDIIDLIGIRMENPDVFEDTHRLIFKLAQSCFSGLRVDHVDGLYEPEIYLQKLRQKLPGAYLVVEKILTDDEQLPASWPVQGTTGYDFLNYVNKLFVEGAGEAKIDDFYRQFTGNTQGFSELLYDCKKNIIQTYFLGEVHNLSRLFTQTLRRMAYGKPYGRSMGRAVVELLACFPVYRTYINEQQRNSEPFRTALKVAQQKNPQLKDEFAAITCLLEESKRSPEALRALMRFQQFTGAVMAKGFEDTALYRYSRLLSLNEVGSNPAQFGISTDEFHEFNRLRQERWPLTLNATSTHDTKRGEDVRARLNVLGEIPGEFASSLKKWARLNEVMKRYVNGKLAPNTNEEYCLYQTLLGAFPWNPNEKQYFSERMKLHMVKALREAKTNTTWLLPNLPYEEAVTAFAAEILENQYFLEAFLPLQQKVAFYGFYNTLAQTLLKITSPGIPDFYQGTELCDLNLVDPDNRRPVNFEKRQNLLAEIALLGTSKAPSLLENFDDGKAKLYVIYRTLKVRRELKALFEEGAYIPLATKGRDRVKVVAFCRKKGVTYVMVVASRFLVGLVKPHERWAGVDWADTHIILPQGAPSIWAEAFTGKTVRSETGQLAVRDALGEFPVALLFSGDMDE